MAHKCTSDTNPVLKYPEKKNAEQKDMLMIGLALHIGYLLIAILSARALWIRLSTLNDKKRLLLRCAILAVFFSPAVIFFFPFVFPSFALLAVFIQLYLVTSLGSPAFLLVQFLLSGICIVMVWVVLVFCGFGIRKYRA